VEKILPETLLVAQLARIQYFSLFVEPESSLPRSLFSSLIPPASHVFLIINNFKIHFNIILPLPSGLFFKMHCQNFICISNPYPACYMPGLSPPPLFTDLLLFLPSVSTMARLRAGKLGNRASIPGRDKRFLSSSECPDKVQSLPSLLFYRFGAFVPPGVKEKGHESIR
jgi:hypothetical protein